MMQHQQTEKTGGDLALLRWVAHHRRSGITRWMKALTLSGNWQSWLGLFAIGIVLSDRTREVSLGVGPSVLMTWAICSMLKRRVNRPRPNSSSVGAEPLMVHPDPYSFPSSHSACAWTACLGLSKFFPAATPVLVLHALGVSFSRIYVGAHYLSDVIAGGILGAAVAIWF